MRANLLFGLKHRPLATPEINEEETTARTEKIAENARAGNTDEDFNDDWVDYKTLGVDKTSTTDDRLIALLEEVDLTRAVYDYGLRSAVDLIGRDGLSDRILDGPDTIEFTAG